MFVKVPESGVVNGLRVMIEHRRADLRWSHPESYTVHIYDYDNMDSLAVGKGNTRFKALIDAHTTLSKLGDLLRDWAVDEVGQDK